MMQAAWKVEPGSNVKLQDYDPDDVDANMDPALAKAELEQLGKELGELQELLAAAHHQSLLVVLQGMDTSGKADTIHQVLSRVNPQGCEVRSFKVPTSRELDHDFLWRVHRVTPGRGVIGIFNRSHYEDEWEAQLVERGEQELLLLAQLGHLEQTGNGGKKRAKKARGAT